MNMKDHILSAMREQFEDWETFLAALREEQVITPRFDLGWSIKDVMAHLWAWQQISIARIESGLQNQEPQYPQWIIASVADWDENANQVNALTFDRNHGKSWTDVHETWRTGFLRLLELSEKISERDLLDGDRYPWLKGYNLALILIASYEHHQEHYEKLNDWLKKYSN